MTTRILLLIFVIAIWGCQEEEIISTPHKIDFEERDTRYDPVGVEIDPSTGEIYATNLPSSKDIRIIEGALDTKNALAINNIIYNNGFYRNSNTGDVDYGYLHEGFAVAGVGLRVTNGKVTSLWQEMGIPRAGNFERYLIISGSDRTARPEAAFYAPNGCVVTGVGVRVWGDDVVTLLVEYHRVGRDLRLYDKRTARIGAIANSSLIESKISLPPNYVMSGLGFTCRDDDMEKVGAVYGVLDNGDINYLRINLASGTDDLRGTNDNVNVTIHYTDGTNITYLNWNQSRSIPAYMFYGYSRRLYLGNRNVNDIAGITLETTFSGGWNSDNWNLRNLTVSASEEYHPRYPIVDKYMLYQRFTEGGDHTSIKRFTGSSQRLRINF